MEKQNKVRAALSKARSVVSDKRAVIGGALLVAASGAHAADPAPGLPAAASQAFTQLGNYAGEMITQSWAVAVPVTLGLIGIKLFKKGANKAT
jgi:hypothetical protein